MEQQKALELINEALRATVKDPTAQAKPAVVAWARREFGGQLEEAGVKPLSDADDAIADALAVAVATWGKWKAEELAKKAPALVGRRGGKFT